MSDSDMRNIPPDDNYNDDNDYNDYEESYQAYDDNPPPGSTRPMANPANPTGQSTPARRPIPAEGMPPVYPRPSLSRREQVRPQPPQPHLPQDPARRPTPPPAYYGGEAVPPRTTPPRPGRQDRRAARQQRQPAQPGYQQKPRPQPKDRSRSGLYLPWWSLVIMLVFVGCAAVGALAVVSTMESGIPVDSETPQIIVITSTFTVGPPASPTPLPQQATLTATRPLPTIPPTLTLPPGDFAIGELVVVIGVGESGLNVRSAPGTISTIKFRASDGDTFVLRDGPQQASGDEWWFIEDANDSTRSGWASRRYMAITSQVVPTATPGE